MAKHGDFNDDRIPPDGRSDPIVELIDAHHEAIYRYAYRLTGSVADAEDLTQQTYLIAQQHLDQLRDPQRASGWLFAILRTCFLKSLRRRRPTAAADLEIDLQQIPALPAADDPIDIERLQQALDGLPDLLRLVVVMYYFEQASYKEIAQSLEIPIGTVMSRLARAKARLRTELAPRPAPTPLNRKEV